VSPSSFGRSIDVGSLLPADIILTSRPGVISSAIRGVTSSPVSHAILHIGNGRIIEATAAGVDIYGLDLAFKDDGGGEVNYAVVLRSPDVDEAVGRNIVDYAKSKLGSSFNYFGFFKYVALMVRLHPDLYSGKPYEIRTQMSNWIGKVELGVPDTTEVFCSQLLVEAFQAGGADFTRAPADWTAPGDVLLKLKEGYLEYVGHLRGGEDWV
jgi:hypothetical protein